MDPTLDFFYVDEHERATLHFSMRFVNRKLVHRHVLVLHQVLYPLRGQGTMKKIVHQFERSLCFPEESVRHLVRPIGQLYPLKLVLDGPSRKISKTDRSCTGAAVHRLRACDEPPSHLFGTISLGIFPNGRPDIVGLKSQLYATCDLANLRKNDRRGSWNSKKRAVVSKAGC